MFKADSYEVDYNFFTKKDGTEGFMDIKAGFKTYAEAEKWSARNTLDGRVVGTCKIEED